MPTHLLKEEERIEEGEVFVSASPDSKREGKGKSRVAKKHWTCTRNTKTHKTHQILDRENEPRPLTRGASTMTDIILSSADNADVGMSSAFSKTGKIAPLCSTTGSYIAYLIGTRLCIRSTRSLAVKRLSELGDAFARAVNIIRWDPKVIGDEERLLLASEEEVRVFVIGKRLILEKVETEQDGTILVGGPICNAQWLTGTVPADNDEEPEMVVRIVVFGRDGVMGAQVWSADGVETTILGSKTPKIAGIFNDGQETLFSLLCRPYTSDALTTYTLRKQPPKLADAPVHDLSLSGVTLDAKTIKFSPSGKFIAILDTPACGYAVHLLSNEFGKYPKLLHTYYGPHYLTTPFDLNILAATIIEWLNVGSQEVLLSGDQNQTVSILSSSTFKPLATLQHFKGHVHRDLPVWSETVSNPSGTLIYSLASLPFTPESASSKGISHLCASPAGSYIATVASSMPNTVWVWRADDSTDEFSELVAVISHTSLIKQLSFRKGPKSSSQLLITLSMCNFVGIWNSTDQQHPQILQFTDLASTDKFNGAWVSPNQVKPGYDIYACDGRSFAVYNSAERFSPDETEDSYVVDPSDDTNVLQIAQDVRIKDREDVLEAEDTFVQGKRQKTKR